MTAPSAAGKQGQRAEPNRLSHETSPYLLQHAYNPVDWYPWGEEALRKARELDRPIFLSIGYSACHWCHVMEHESFEEDEIAALMNRWFINIKVDREERPDLDQIYMNAVMALTRHGGWPMSVFLTPDLKPFYGGTYWPPTSRMGMPGFRDILEKVHEAWETRREDVLRGAEELTGAVIQMGLPQGAPSQLTDSLLKNATRALLQAADRIHGGFGGAPKFPHPMDLRVLLRSWKRFGSEDALDIVRLTLDKMAGGGIYDHLGGGFHRYSTDERWLVPHFEKMLYDNALLTSAYLEAYQATGAARAVAPSPGGEGRGEALPLSQGERGSANGAEYARVVRETLEYVLREMTQPDGGFYSTQDADSEGVEGKFFVWTEEEIFEHLGPDDARVFNYCYDVTREGNWEGNNILNRVKTHEQAARILGLSEDELSEILERSKRRLFDVRTQRVAPGRDDKVLVSWNGLMIAAMAQAGSILGEAKYTEAAARAAEFILQNMRSEEGRLLHSYKDGRARFNAYLDDYACLIDGLVDLYQATFEASYLQSALDLADQMVARFYDEEGGGFFFTSADHERLIARNKEIHDSATPSGNSMAATALLRLGRLCSRPDLEEKAVATLEMLSSPLARQPTAAGQALLALDFLLGPAHEIVIVDSDRPEETDEVLATLFGRFAPNKVVARKPAGLTDDQLPTPLEPLLKGKTASEGRATIYVCERGTCGLPIVGAADLAAALQT